MKIKMISMLLITAAVATVVFSGFKKIEGSGTGTFNKVATNDLYSYIDINQIFMYLSNNGDASYDPIAGSSGLFWPGGKNAVLSAVYEDGLIWGGKIGREVRVNGSVYRHGLQAGPILGSGLAADPSDAKYRI